MRIAIATVQVPFIRGGAEILVDMLRDELKKRGHQVDVITIPFKWYPGETLVNCMMMGRMSKWRKARSCDCNEIPGLLCKT